MSWWVIHNNIRDFKEKISRETDPEKRRVLKQLLAEEEEKQRRLAEEPRQLKIP